MAIFKIIGRCSNHLALVKLYLIYIIYLFNLRDLSLIGRVSNCHLEGFQFESGRSRLIFIILRLNNYIIIYILELNKKLYNILYIFNYINLFI